MTWIIIPTIAIIFLISLFREGNCNDVDLLNSGSEDFDDSDF